MEKKEMSFIEQFEAAGNELEKKMEEESKNGAMIMIAAEEPKEEGICANIKGKPVMLSALLAYVACKDKGFKMLLIDAIKFVEMHEQKNK